MLVLLGFFALGLLGTGGYFGFRLLALHLAEDRVLRARKLDLDERTVAVTEQRSKSVAPPASIPPDLMRRVTQWQNEDARDAERKVILDLYATYQDDADPWLSVRQSLPAYSESQYPGEVLS